MYLSLEAKTQNREVSIEKDDHYQVVSGNLDILMKHDTHVNHVRTGMIVTCLLLVDARSDLGTILLRICMKDLVVVVVVVPENCHSNVRYGLYAFRKRLPGADLSNKHRRSECRISVRESRRDV